MMPFLLFLSQDCVGNWIFLVGAPGNKFSSLFFVLFLIALRCNTREEKVFIFYF